MNFLGLCIFHNVLIPKIYEVILVALLIILQDILLQFMGIEHILLLLLNLGLVLDVRFIHHSDLVLFVLIHKLLMVCIEEKVLRRRPFTALIPRREYYV